jgi:hypothetical protein
MKKGEGPTSRGSMRKATSPKRPPSEKENGCDLSMAMERALSAGSGEAPKQGCLSHSCMHALSMKGLNAVSWTEAKAPRQTLVFMESTAVPPAAKPNEAKETKPFRRRDTRPTILAW